MTGKRLNNNVATVIANKVNKTDTLRRCKPEPIFDPETS